ncbi:Hypothetical protein NTJ_07406 [Nesidiocoris tenuis]|uniref:Uncharacterized protein n=1 Tax=Nesidiocoris tenuis TaxID=355587 RepID=A0ABN7AVW9_9HEMI|nr:Hypothetical protein NTJ_07406 [Nesidiocoris tenuis]
MYALEPKLRFAALLQCTAADYLLVHAIHVVLFVEAMTTRGYYPKLSFYISYKTHLDLNTATAEAISNSETVLSRFMAQRIEVATVARKEALA